MTKRQINPWIEVAYVVMMQMVTMGVSFYCFGYFVVPWMGEFETGRGDLMLAVGISSIFLAFLSPYGGRLMDSYDKRKLILCSSALFSLGLVGASMATNYWVIVFIYGAVVPIGMVFSGPLMAYSVISKSRIERKGLAMGITASGASLGGIALVPLVVYVLEQNDWRVVHWYLAAITMAVVFIPAFFIIRSESSSARAANTSQASTFALLRSSPVIYLGLAQVLPGFIFAGTLHNLGSLALDLGIEQQQAATITATLATLMILSKITVGWLIDRVSATLIYTMCILLLIVGLIVTALSNGYLALLTGVCCIGVVMAGLLPLMSTLVHRHWGATVFGSVLGVTHFIGAFGTTGSTVLGYARDITGDYTIAFLSLLALVPIAAFCFYRFTKTAPLVVESES